MMPNSIPPIDNFLGRLDKVSRNGAGWMARCPAHNDGRPSLKLTEAPDRRVLLHCFAGCAPGDICSALGLTMQDLFPPEPSNMLHMNGSTPKGKTVEIYEYKDADGRLLFQVLRKEPKNFPQRRLGPDGSWVYQLGDTPRVLYRLPELLAADPSRPVVICEGEKDVERLIPLGAVATCNPGGAKKWKPEYGQWLKGRQVVILEDNDEVGHEHAEQVAWHLAGVADAIKVIKLPDLQPKGDVSDWLDDGHTIQEFWDYVIKQPRLDTNSFQSTSEPEKGEQKGNEGEQRAPYLAVPISQLAVQSATLEWNWNGYIAPEQITLFTGLWKSGKSTLLSLLLRDLAGDHSRFCGRALRPSRVLLVSEETAIKWVERRDKLLIQDHISLVCKPWRRPPTKADWEALLTKVAAQIEAEGQDILVIDSLHNLWAVKDENNAAEVREAMQAFSMITALGTAVFILAHPSKGDQTEGRATRGTGLLPSYANILIEMRRYDAEHATDTRRVLKGYSHWDETPDELVIELDRENMVYRAIGSKGDVRAGDRLKVIVGLLPSGGVAYTVEEIARDWPEGEDIPRPGKTTLKRDLEYGAGEGLVGVRGSGKKNDPFRYHAL